ncbi:MAG TPA: hypothetical protein VLM89_16855, partial [Phycisphaerae bacterium]|nr:hypothetical protein [Phycisphaerae bacterium]
MMRIFALVMLVGGWMVSAAAAQQPADGEESRRVVVIGRAAGTNLVAEEEATLDALREAVRQVCGSFINAQSETENYELVRDKVLEQPVGFAQKLKVLKGPEIVAGEITQLQIEVEVFPVRFQRRWAEFAHIKQREGNPRCVVAIIEDDDITDTRPPHAGGPVQAAIEDFFLGKDVQLMDKQVSDAVRKRDLDLAAINGDQDKLAALGQAFRADVVLFGRAEGKPGQSIRLGEHTFPRWELMLTVKAVQTDSAAILMSRTYIPTRPATGNGREQLVALARESAPKVLADVGEAWRKRATVGKTVQLVLQPCSRQRFKAIQTEMIQLKGITGGADGFKLRELTNEVAQVDVEWKYDLDQLADRIEQLRVIDDG